MARRQPELHRWIGRLGSEFSLQEWITFCRTALVVWKAIEDQLGPSGTVSQDDLQAASAINRDGLARLSRWPRKHVARSLFSQIGEYEEADLLMFAGFRYDQALKECDHGDVRPEKGPDFIRDIWIMIDAMVMAFERSRAAAEPATTPQAEDLD